MNALTIASAITLLIAGAVSKSADANSYRDAVDRQERCKTSGELAQSMRGATAKDIDKILGDAAAKVKRKELSKKKYIELGDTVLAGAMARTDQDAYMRGWAICMDAK